MTTSIERFVQIKPVFLRCLSGRWLAVSDEGAQLHIGVEATSKREAEERFHTALMEWESLWTDDHRTAL